MNYAVVVSKKFSEFQIHYRVTSTDMTFSVDLNEFLRAVAVAMELPQTGLFKKAPLLAADELLHLMRDAAEKVVTEIKSVSSYNPPPMG